jgi:signal transduction histidine kinase
MLFEKRERSMQEVEIQIQEVTYSQPDVKGLIGALVLPDSPSENLARIAHDARNMVTALDLYCDLLQEPGVLSAQFSHYGRELKLVAATSRSLVGKLAALEESDSSRLRNSHNSRTDSEIFRASKSRQQAAGDSPVTAPVSIGNFAAEVLLNRNLLSALAGPTVAVTVDVEKGALPVDMSSEDLTRILVNLVKNAVEAMSSVGRVHISLWESEGNADRSSWITLNVEDNGPGFSNQILGDAQQHFSRLESQTTSSSARRIGRGPGLGLAIIRSIVEAAGGRFHIANRDPIGACVQIELPVCDAASAVIPVEPVPARNATLN